MKPSLRIKEIFQSSEKNYLGNEDITYATYSIKAILDYLDEQWEKEQPCKEHKYTEKEDYHDDYCARCLKPRVTPV